MADRPPPEKITRNWNELLQELRVVQTGSQILTGFLLTVPFSTRWDDLTPHQVLLYLAVMTGTLVTTAFVLAPVAFHRMLFRQHQRYWLVERADLMARIGLTLLALTSSGVVLLVFDVAVGPTAGVVAFCLSVSFFALLWMGVPRLARRS